jgi:hypothetical protein
MTRGSDSSQRAARNDTRCADDRGAAAESPSGESPPDSLTHGRTDRAKAEPIDALLRETESWIATLASELQPSDLCRSHPRIANELAALWGRPDEFATYLKELLAAGEGGRRRFPIGIARELHALKAYHASLHPGALSPARRPG